MQAWPVIPTRFAMIAGVALGVVGGGVGLAAGASLWAPLIAVGVGGSAWYLLVRRYLARRSLLATPMPEAWRRILERRVPFYRGLDGEAKRRFEDDVRIFVAEQRIFTVDPRGGGPRTDLDDGTRVLIGASAAMLGHGLPEWEWPHMRDILVYPGAFDENYEDDGDANIAGMVHHQGPIIFSRRDLKRGFKRSTDGHNVGIHELAHVMDLADGYADGIPAGGATTAPWTRVITERLRKLHRNEYQRVLRDYAGTNEAEFFAVAVESFFERPRKLREGDPELYRLLADYFRQDPAGARGGDADE